MGSEKRNAVSPSLIKELLRGCGETGEVEGVCLGEALLPHFYCPSTYTKCQKEQGAGGCENVIAEVSAVVCFSEGLSRERDRTITTFTS